MWRVVGGPPHHSAVLAHWVLKERLNLFGMVGCALCINGSVTIVLHTPAERPIESVLEVWNMVFQPGGARRQGGKLGGTARVGYVSV
jgi:hypothetical protein